MEVLDPRNTVITNAEVLRLLQGRRKQQNELPKDQRSKILGTVIYEVALFIYTLFAGFTYSYWISSISIRIHMMILSGLEELLK